MEFTEDEVLALFSGMRNGVIRNYKGKPYIDVSSFAKVFCSFWRWYARTKKRDGITVLDVVADVDTRMDRKPLRHHFGLRDVERMAGIAPYFEYKALVYFLFDSGIRAPKELMNVRVMDITPVPDSPHKQLWIREETSKTFGRKIKLMICSDVLQKYITEKTLQPNDFLFANSPIVYNCIIAKIGYRILGIGTPHKQHETRGYIQKTLIKNGITMYDFRHNSICYYLPIYNSENQMKYRYGWKKADMIHYYSEFIGMKDTITDQDMLIDTTKTQIEQQLTKEQQKVQLLREQFNAQKQAMEERIQKLEAMMLQRFADNYQN